MPDPIRRPVAVSHDRRRIIAVMDDGTIWMYCLEPECGPASWQELQALPGTQANHP